MPEIDREAIRRGEAQAKELDYLRSAYGVLAPHILEYERDLKRGIGEGDPTSTGSEFRLAFAIDQAISSNDRAARVEGLSALLRVSRKIEKHE